MRPGVRRSAGSLSLLLIEFEHQARLVELNPAHVSGGEHAKEFFVGGQDRVQQIEGGRSLPRARLELREREERHGTGNYRPRLDSDRAGLVDLGEYLRRVEAEQLVYRELRDDVVVVRVKPLGHLESRDVDPRVAVLRPARHREVPAERIRDASIALGDGAHGDRHVEHVIVE